MRSKVLVVSSVLLGLGSALVSHTAVAKTTEDSHSICTDLYVKALGDNKINCHKRQFVDLVAIQDKNNKGTYSNEEQAANNLLAALGDTHFQVTKMKSVSMFDQLRTYARDENFTLKLGKKDFSVYNFKDHAADEIEATILKQKVADKLLVSSTNELMTDYRMLRQYDNQLRAERTAAKTVGQTTTEIDQRREKVAAMITQLKVIARDQMAQYNVKLTNAQADRLLESAVGQEEIKLIIVGHNLDRAITVIQGRMKASDDSQLAVNYEGDLALLNKVASAAIEAYISKINTSFLKTLNATIAESKDLVANNTDMKDKTKEVNRHVQMLAMSYKEILIQRVADLQTKKEALRPNFHTLAVNYATGKLAQDTLDTVIEAETTNVDIDAFLKLGNLSNDGADGMNVTQNALLQIEDSLFAPK